MLKAFISDISFIKDENRGQFEAVRASFDQLVEGNFSKKSSLSIRNPRNSSNAFSKFKENLYATHGQQISWKLGNAL